MPTGPVGLDMVSHQPPGRGRSVMAALALALLADRDADTRQMYAEHLRRLAYEIDEAEDGRESGISERLASSGITSGALGGCGMFQYRQRTRKVRRVG